MTGVIICDSCGKGFIANGSLESIKTKTPIVVVLSAMKLLRFNGTRKIISKSNGKNYVVEFKDKCKRCSEK